MEKNIKDLCFKDIEIDETLEKRLLELEEELSGCGNHCGGSNEDN